MRYLWLPIAVLGALLSSSNADAQYLFPNRYPSPNDPVLAPPSGNGWNYSDYQVAVYGGYVMRFPPEATTWDYQRPGVIGYLARQTLVRPTIVPTSDILPAAYGTILPAAYGNLAVEAPPLAPVLLAPDNLSLYRADAVYPINPGYAYPGIPLPPVQAAPAPYAMPRVR
jgi:hypothetical protein